MFSDFELIKEHTTRIIAHNLEFGGSYHSMEKFARVINETPNASIRVPRTKYKINKMIQPKFSTEIHIKCDQCLKFSGTQENETECVNCCIKLKTSDSAYFMYFPIHQQLEHNITLHIDEILKYYSEVIEKTEITDIHNGVVFKNLQKTYPNHIILPLVVNTDGVKFFKSSKDSLWLIQAYQSYLEPKNRYVPRTILIIGAHFATKKPNMSDFFEPFLKELRAIIENGGIRIEHNGKMHQFMPLIVSACCDLPAKSDVQGLTGHAGQYACGYCLHPGVPIKSGKTTTYRYVDGSYEPRTHKKFIETYQNQKQMVFGKSIKGIRKVSCFVAVKHFDMVDGFSIDHMHLELNMMRKLFSLWLDSVNHKQPYYIKPKNQILLSKRLVEIKPVCEITRKPRSIFSRADFKANEYRSLLLFYLPFALNGLLSARYVQHFRLFSSAMYLLLKEKILNDDIHEAEKKLNQFVAEFEILYGKENVTINLHLLKHLAPMVRKLGPCWTQSAYGFEAVNGTVTKANTATWGILHQLAWKYTMRKTVQAEKKETCKFQIGGEKVLRITDTEINMFSQARLMQQTKFLKIFKNIVLNGVKFTSKQCKEISSIDYFVSFKNESIAAIHYYVHFDFILYAVAEEYKCVESVEHFVQIRSTGIKKVMRVNEISKKLLYLKFGTREFITIIPNKFEKT